MLQSIYKGITGNRASSIYCRVDLQGSDQEMSAFKGRLLEPTKAFAIEGAPQDAAVKAQSESQAAT